MLKIKFLGTSAAIPTSERNTPSIYLEHDFDMRFLFDVGEGTQKSLMQYKLKFMRINHIFISHWHADHFAGLITLIHTMGLEGRKEPLHIYGPRRSKEFVNSLLSIGYYSRKFDVVVHELKDKSIVEFEHFTITSFSVNHRVPSLGYVFEEKPRKKANLEKAKKFGLSTSPLIGKLKRGESIVFNGKRINPEDIIEEVRGIKVVYSGDTRYTSSLVEMSKDADLLICDSTLREKDYDESIYHLSNERAAEIAKLANVKHLILTHISRRYTSKEEELKKMLQESQQIFPSTLLAYDGMEVHLKHNMFRVVE